MGDLGAGGDESGGKPATIEALTIPPSLLQRADQVIE
jgi:hypothetical protein